MELVLIVYIINRGGEDQEVEWCFKVRGADESIDVEAVALEDWKNKFWCEGDETEEEFFDEVEVSEAWANLVSKEDGYKISLSK